MAETKRAEDFGNEYKLIADTMQGSQEVDSVLQHIGVSHDRESIVMEDSWSSLMVLTGEGEYVEVWGSHDGVTMKHSRFERLA